MEVLVSARSVILRIANLMALVHAADDIAAQAAHRAHPLPWRRNPFRLTRGDRAVGTAGLFEAGLRIERGVGVDPAGRGERIIELDNADVPTDWQIAGPITAA